MICRVNAKKNHNYLSDISLKREVNILIVICLLTKYQKARKDIYIEWWRHTEINLEIMIFFTIKNYNKILIPSLISFSFL